MHMLAILIKLNDHTHTQKKQKAQISPFSGGKKSRNKKVMRGKRRMKMIHTHTYTNKYIYIYVKLSKSLKILAL